MELESSFLRCEAIHLKTGEKRVFEKEECHFGYRDSIFKTELKGQYIITSVDFKLLKQANLKTDYVSVAKYLTEHDLKNPTLQQLHDAICAIRDGKLPDPKVLGNAGSFFKNPVIEKADFELLKKQHQYPDKLDYRETDGKVKLIAAQLIEQTGWKGEHYKHVGVYKEHALILVHYGDGQGQEIVELVQRIQDSVEKKFGIKISPEVNFV